MGLAPDVQAGNGLDAGYIGVAHCHQAARDVAIAGHAQELHGRPGRRHRAARPGAGEGGGGKQTVGPVVDVEDLELSLRVVLPASLPGIFTAIRVSLGVGVTMLVGAEMIATSNGIAWMALSAADFLLTDVVLVGVLMMATLGYSLDQLARLIERRLVHWSGKDA